MIRSAIGILAIAMTASAARPIAAEDLALVLVNSDYATLDDLSGDRYAARFESELEGAGFTTFALQDGTAAETSAMVRDFAAAVGAGRDNRIVIILSGHLVHTGAETWLLAEDARNPDGFTVATMGQALSPLFALAGDAQGRAVVLLAPSGDAGETGIALSSGGGDIAVPQGVTRVTGEVRALFTALRDGLLPADATYASAAARAPRGVTYEGFLSSAIGLRTGASPAAPGPNRPDPGEFAYWNAAQDIGSDAALRAYLDRYPEGTFAADARARISALKDAPLKRAQDAEDDLALTREARREVQRHLTILGFDTRGTDGIFGPATRKALTDWQGARRFGSDGYLDAQQLATLRSEGAARAAELERDAEARRAAEEQKDRDYWARTGSTGDKAGLQTYLDRYPDGLFADTAKERLTRIAQAEQDRATAEARAAWLRATEADTEEAYIAFLRAHPDSPFEDAARQRITELREPPRDDSAERAAEAEESRVVGNQVTRLLVERRLLQLGMEPGTPDGAFDAQTRRAIRRFQNSRGIEVTGYVTQATLVRLLAG